MDLISGPLIYYFYEKRKPHGLLVLCHLVPQKVDPIKMGLLWLGP
jgi:hypothetical protein